MAPKLYSIISKAYTFHTTSKLDRVNANPQPIILNHVNPPLAIYSMLQTKVQAPAPVNKLLLSSNNLKNQMLC